MRNLGEVSQKQLASVGINTLEDLQKIGALEAFKLLEDYGYHPTKNMMYSLIGAIEDQDWKVIAAEMKEEDSNILKDQ